MDGNRRWLGWIAIGISGLALLVAVFGRGFGRQVVAAGSYGANAPQPYAQQAAGQPAAGPQSGAAAPGANAQPEAGRQRTGPQSGAAASGTSVQREEARQGRGPQDGVAARGTEARHGAGRPRDAGFGLGGWLRFPLKLIGGSFQFGMLALLILLGVWLIRGRTAGGAANIGRAEPAHGPTQAPQSPTGESYIDEPGDQE